MALTLSASAQSARCGAELAGYGPYEVGAVSATVANPLRGGQPVEVTVFYPTEDDVGAADAAVYPQILPWRPIFFGLPEEAVEFPLTAEDYYPMTERLAYEGVAPVEGRPLIQFLPGQGNTGLAFVPEALILASWGFAVALVTHRLSAVLPSFSGDFCELNRDAAHVLTELATWNDTAGHPLEGAFDFDSVIGMGHSIGGRTHIARASSETRCDLPREPYSGIVSEDGTWEALDHEQMAGMTDPIFLNSQSCRFTQIALQQELGYSHVQRLDVVGVTPQPSLDNHGLFAQTCLWYEANLAAGYPVEILVVPGTAERCTPEYTSRVQQVTTDTTRFNLAWIFANVLGERSYRSVVNPGCARQVDGVHLVQTAIGHGNDDAVEGFCTQPGEQDGESPLIQF